MPICNYTALVSTIDLDIKYSMDVDQSKVTWYFTAFEFTLINQYIIFFKLFVFKLILIHPLRVAVLLV